MQIQNLDLTPLDMDELCKYPYELCTIVLYDICGGVVDSVRIPFMMQYDRLQFYNASFNQLGVIKIHFGFSSAESEVNWPHTGLMPPGPIYVNLNIRISWC